MAVGPREIESRFGFHEATIEGKDATQPKHAELRHMFREFAMRLDEMLPDNRTKSLCFTELETASMWSHKSIAESDPLIEE